MNPRYVAGETEVLVSGAPGFGMEESSGQRLTTCTGTGAADRADEGSIRPKYGKTTFDFRPI
jgi:hypothetical protein